MEGWLVNHLILIKAAGDKMAAFMAVSNKWDEKVSRKLLCACMCELILFQQTRPMMLLQSGSLKYTHPINTPDQ